MEIETEVVTCCALCGSGARSLVLADCSDRRYGLAGRFNLVRCKSCGHVYLSPRPSKGARADYYPTEYAPYRPARVRGAADSTRARAAHQ